MLVRHFAVIVILVVFSECGKTNRVAGTRTVTKGYREIYLGPNSELTTTHETVDKIVQGLNLGFNLNPIDSSCQKQEVRIFHFTFFRGRFFIQQYDSGISKFKLYNCGLVNNNDSLIFRIGESISFSRRLNYVIPDLEMLPEIRIDSIENNTTTLDAANTYLIQVKTADNQIKKIFIDLSSAHQASDIGINSICQFIRNVENGYNFRFWDSWDSTKKYAFK